MALEQILSQSPIGKKSTYITDYTPELLYSIPRKEIRKTLHLNQDLFQGTDIWTAYELSWLNAKGKPQVAIAEFTFPIESENILECKSIETYLYSFSQTRFSNPSEVQATIEKDLSARANANVKVLLFQPLEWGRQLESPSGISLDNLDVTVDTYEINSSFLKAEKKLVEETVYTHLLKFVCPIIAHPDWGSLTIRYVGPQIDHPGLLKYLISYRNHRIFFEQCVEKIFLDIWEKCTPSKLTVFGQFVRRGGLDANIFRSNFEKAAQNSRMIRQ